MVVLVVAHVWHRVSRKFPLRRVHVIGTDLRRFLIIAVILAMMLVLAMVFKQVLYTTIIVLTQLSQARQNRWTLGIPGH